jgi:thiamine-phosphate pyrophosphorylase
MYSRDLKLIKKFYIVTKLDILTSNYFKHKNIAVIINLKNQPDSSIIRNIIKKNIYNKIFVSNNTKLITSKKIQGIYLSGYSNKIFLSNKNHIFNYDVIGGAHNLSEIRKKIQIGCNMIFLSPVFKTTSGPEKRPIGLIKYLLISKMFKTKIYPLGGVDPKKISWFLSAEKFAGISYFK